MAKAGKVIALALIQAFCIIYLNPAYAGDYKILINIPSKSLELLRNDRILKTYAIGVGKANFPTPIGNFRVISKVIQPGWENPYKSVGKARKNPGRKNPLGTRWIGFYKDKTGVYGIHGTNEPSSVGKYSSHGCIRMRIKESEDLFSRVDINTPVQVTYYTYRVIIKGDIIFVCRYPHIYRRKISPAGMIDRQLKTLGRKYTVNQTGLSKALNLRVGQSVEIGKIIETGPIFNKNHLSLKFRSS